jgi:glutathione S-transferase
VSDELPVLWQYSFSNYNEKARWALDFKGIRHRRRSLLPGGPKAMAFSRGGGTLPILDLDGRRIGDSTEIIGALEERTPDPPLYPADQNERRQALELEGWFTDSIGHDMRRVVFWDLRDRRSYLADLLGTEQGIAGRAQIRAMMPVAWRYVVRRYDFNQESYDRSTEALVGALDRIESERNGGEHLVGDSFSVADLTAAALLYPLVQPPEFQYELPDTPSTGFLDFAPDHPARAWISETWRRHRGSSAAV